jgi:hypothetical protein
MLASGATLSLLTSAIQGLFPGCRKERTACKEKVHVGANACLHCSALAVSDIRQLPAVQAGVLSSIAQMPLSLIPETLFH